MQNTKLQTTCKCGEEITFKQAENNTNWIGWNYIINCKNCKLTYDIYLTISITQ